MIRVKICGVTTLDNALMCAEAGADLIGLNFYPKSPRSLPVEAARRLADDLRQTLGERCPLLVGVFVNVSIETIRAVMDTVHLDLAQLSGDETENVLAALDGRAIKVVRPRSRDEALHLAACYLPYAPQETRFPSLLLDAYHKDLYGGTGEQANVDLTRAVREIAPRLLVAGGLTPDNVGERADLIQPWGVDVASGVESGQPGIKDAAKVRAFVVAVRAVEALGS